MSAPARIETTRSVTASPLATVRDLVALTKPRITLMVLLTAAGGMWLAPAHVSVATLAVALGAMALVVGAANALNMWLERDVDRLMARTRARPLPADRLAPRTALLFSLAHGAISIPVLALAVSGTTAILGAVALVSYVCVYTPLKQISPVALLVGAVPGAIPPVMGWTAATGSIDPPAVVLFGILFAWQIPHFIAIATFRKDEYAAAGLKVLPGVRGERVARLHAIAWAAVLLAVSVLLAPLGAAGIVYTVVAVVAGVVYLAATLRGDARWAKRTFVASLVYLPVVFAVLMADGR